MGAREWKNQQQHDRCLVTTTTSAATATTTRYWYYHIASLSLPCKFFEHSADENRTRQEHQTNQPNHHPHTCCSKFILKTVQKDFKSNQSEMIYSAASSESCVPVSSFLRSLAISLTTQGRSNSVQQQLISSITKQSAHFLSGHLHLPSPHHH